MISSFYDDVVVRYLRLLTMEIDALDDLFVLLYFVIRRRILVVECEDVQVA